MSNKNTNSGHMTDANGVAGLKMTLPDGATLNQRRRRAVELRLDGIKLTEVSNLVGLSNPTIISAHKAFISGGWDAVTTPPRGRSHGAGQISETKQQEIKQQLSNLLPEAFSSDQQLWSQKLLIEWLANTHSIELNPRTIARYTKQWNLSAQPHLNTLKQSASSKDHEWLQNDYSKFKRAARKQGQETYWLSAQRTGSGTLLLAHNTKGTQLWLAYENAANTSDYLDFLNRLKKQTGKSLALIVHGVDFSTQELLTEWFEQQHSIYLTALRAFSPTAAITPLSSRELPMSSRAAETENGQTILKPTMGNNVGTSGKSPATTPSGFSRSASLTHLQRLEAESIHIMREVIAEADNPVMLYSVGKDSAVMLHLARKAFYPAPPPFPLLHIDTTWKFKAMYEFRDKLVDELGLELLIHSNPEGIEKGVNPFTHGSSLHTDIMKTEALKQALDKHGFDVAFGGARRDEEKSRAKERVFSFRTEQHRWDPKNQRPELWKLYNTRKRQSESIRAFPISNWTELDIWQYIHLESIPIVPLYYSAERPVVERDGALIMVDDERMPMKPGEVPMMRQVRFRTLGCYPLTGAVESSATTLPQIIAEMLVARTSERQGRMIDHDTAASMEKKKQEGYF